MAANISGGNVGDEFLWSCLLTGSNKEYIWEPATFDGPLASHRLLIKTAFLSPTAKKDEVTVVEIETLGYNEKKV